MLSLFISPIVNPWSIRALLCALNLRYGGGGMNGVGESGVNPIDAMP